MYALSVSKVMEATNYGNDRENYRSVRIFGRDGRYVTVISQYIDTDPQDNCANASHEVIK